MTAQGRKADGGKYRLLFSFPFSINIYSDFLMQNSFEKATVSNRVAFKSIIRLLSPKANDYYIIISISFDCSSTLSALL